MEAWSLQLLFERKDGKPEQLLQLDDHSERINKRYDLVMQSARDIGIMLENNYRLYSNIPLEEVKILTEEVNILFISQSVISVV